ncbi:MAG: hypothetical protein AMXMBFR4_06690 [Candidatus Hydrogenedentota bacterium]
MNSESETDPQKSVPWWPTVLCAALAGGMGWGIRGQYGHETGAMIAGLLVCLVISLTLCRGASSLAVARAVALGTIAIGFGGTETYGQTVGLTHDKDFIGNWEALRWGMTGLAVKGGVWIGFCGVFLGMGLGGNRYRAHELLVLMLGALAAYFLGVWLFNLPFDPENKRLPWLYFSGSWYWQPDKADLRPRFEAWGGLWFALLLVIAYAGAIRKDGLAWRLAMWGILGGALGFPLGQCLQAYHAWNPEVFTQGIWKSLDPHMNWWNMMETTFGTIMGAALGLGAWIHRERIKPADYISESYFSPPLEWVLLSVHAALLVLSEFVGTPIIDVVYDLGLAMGLIPLFATAGGRMWPYFVVFPVTLLPIAGKTLRNLAYEQGAISPAIGWAVYVIVPIAIAVGFAVWYGRRTREGRPAIEFLSGALVFATWTYFLLNYAFFRFPWPWAPWTGRTPNAILFTVCAVGLTTLAITALRKLQEPRPTSTSRT